ncbi:alpha/beta fold hydrolase [Candidatus Woesebacteria bacterium]|nr:alpha/beta fold hydrolase [Candidatus Woesebacteria bacterium]
MLFLGGVLVIAAVGWWQRDAFNFLNTSDAPEERTNSPVFQNVMNTLETQISPHPATIAGMRQTELGETELAIEQVYSENTAYTSYRASYQSEGNTIYGLLTVPKSARPENGYPAIIFLHGYIPPDQYVTTERYVSYVDSLARADYVVFKIDYRGHGESEGEPSGAYHSPGYVFDTLYAAKALEQDDRVNAQAIGLWGHSMSGNITLRSAAVNQQFPAAVIWAGAGFTYRDLEKYRISDSSFVRSRKTEQEILERAQSLREQFGQYSENTAFWEQMDPTNYLGGVETAFQLHHAENDSVVNPGYSRDLAKIFEDEGVEHELYLYSTGGHDIEGQSFNTAMQRTIQFFDTYLK